MSEGADTGSPLAPLVGWALTGTRLELLAGGTSAEIAASLREGGWDSDRVARVRDERQAAGQPWPLIVPANERGTMGAAQLLSAALATAAELGVHPPTRVRATGIPLSSHDLALIADRPPHHGSS